MLTKLGKMTHTGPQQPIDCKNFQFLKIQVADANWKIKKLLYLSNGLTTFTKFGMMMQNGYVKRPGC